MSDKLEVTLYSKVKLDDDAVGIVKYMGGIMGKKGVFYGLDVSSGEAKNDGTFKGIKYFDTGKGMKTGRFCTLKKIVKAKATSKSKFPYTIGETVMCTKTKCKGVVKYVGVPSWVKGGKVYIGLELEKKKGTCNGTTQGVQYFEAKMKHGIYVPAKEVTKIDGAKKKKKKNDEEEDVRAVMKDYYSGKSQDSPTSKKKKKKPSASNTKQAAKKKKVSTPTTSKPAEAKTPETQLTHDTQASTMSVDYMDEEKDLDFAAYAEKTEQIDTEKAEKARREQIEQMKEMERRERQQREEEKLQKQREQEERDKQKQAEIDARNAAKQQELEKKQKELKDKERLQKYAEAKKQQEEQEKERQRKQAELEEQKKQNELLKQQELEAKKAKEEQERKQREEQAALAEKLKQEKEAQEAEEKKPAEPSPASSSPPSGGIVTSGISGSLKDRMAMFGGGGGSTPKKSPSSPMNTYKKSPPISPQTKPLSSPKPKPVSSPKVNGNFPAPSKNNDGGAIKVDSKQINEEMNAAIGKPFESLKMTKAAGYAAEIPLVLYLLGERLKNLNSFGTTGLFLPEKMEEQTEKPEMQVASNIFLFFAKLPRPLLDRVEHSVLDKAISKDAMKAVTDAMNEPYASTLIYLWDLLAKVAMNPNARMGQQSLGKVFGPMCTMVTQQDMKGNRVSMNVLAASRNIAFFRRGIEWRMEVQGFNFEDSDDDDD